VSGFDTSFPHPTAGSGLSDDLRETLEELLSRVEEDKLPVEGWEENGQVSSFFK
jgi:hypothetical protein